MQFSSFTEEEIEEINRRTILRLRAQQARDLARIGQPDAAITPAFTDNKAQESSAAAMFGDAAKFSESDIRNAFIAAMKRLHGSE